MPSNLRHGVQEQARKLYGSVPIVQKKARQRKQEVKLFKRYVADIVCTVKGSSLDYLEYANSLHKNLQFPLETPSGSGDPAFLDLNIKVNEDRKIKLSVV